MKLVALFCSLISLGTFASTFPAKLSPLPANALELQKDLNRITHAAGLPSQTLQFKFVDKIPGILIRCEKNQIILEVAALEEEKTASIYKGLRELGFYFPHPFRQISPTLTDLKKSCGKSFKWNPTLKYRGLHLHTLHPNEWVDAFFMDKPHYAEALVRWLARNNQNLLDISLLRLPLEEIARQFRPHYELAHKLQIHTGVSLGVALQQQKSFKLLSLYESYVGYKSNKLIKERIRALLRGMPLSFVVLEAGSSEFTPTNYKKTLKWLGIASKVSTEENVAFFTKVHVSTNQHSKEWGNFNFLPQFAKSHVGILPHTVMFYSLKDKKAPVYGNTNFENIRKFTEQEKTKRPTWYYPETSYWVGMDVDVPLLLTDFLLARAEDMKWLKKEGIEGQLNFTSGQVLGYWLNDWTTALLADGDYEFNPLIGVKLLKEDIESWKKISAYQNHWYKNEGLISTLSGANLMDEISSTHRVHERFTMRDLANSPEKLKKEIATLEKSLETLPDINMVVDEELKTMLQVTHLRQEHALMVRLALQNVDTKARHLERAHELRLKAQKLILKMSERPTNYPELPLFKKWPNPTSYQFGYVYPAATLYFWEREETQIKEDSYFPFWNNLYNVWDILF